MQPIETNVIKPEVKFLHNDVEYFLMDQSTESTLDTKVNNINQFMSLNEGKGKSDEEKDSLYRDAQMLWSDFASSLKEAKYNFYLNRPQHKFLTNLILTKLEYDTNTVFFAIELTEMLSGMKDAKYVNDTDIVPFAVNTTEITYIYHLISKHKIQGLTRDAYTFAQILRKIGEISKIFNYYDAMGKSLSTEVQDWVAAFEDGVTRDIAVEEVVETAEVSKPKTKKK
jgi:hypothetical protein